MQRMKDTEIHDNLENKEIRDFLADQISTCRILVSTETIKEEIKKLEKKLKESERFDALKILIDHLGFEEFDVSDYVEKSGPKNCRPFIGTQEEYDEFIDRPEVNQ